MTEAGFVRLEEDVLVTQKGCIFLSSFPQELFLVDPLDRKALP